MNIQDWFPLGLTGLISLQSKGLSRVFSNTTVQKHQFFSAQLSLYSNSHDQSWVFIGRTDVEAETPILWSPDVKSWFIWKDPDAGKDWRQEKGLTEEEMVGWHHWLDGHEFEQAPEMGDGQGSLVCYSPWGCKELDITEWLNWTELNWDYKQKLWTAIFKVSSMELTHCLGPFPNWDSWCAVTWDFPALIKSGCWSKPNLVVYLLLFLFLFSFNVSMLKVS